MKINELRIGNCILIDCIMYKEERKVTEICPDGVFAKTKYTANMPEIVFIKEDDIEPIELTEEILMKIGFKKNKYDWWKYFPDRENEISILMTENYTIIEYANLFHCPEDVTEVNYGSTLEFPRRIYLHQLQNAYYCLTGEELNIEL